MEFTFQKEICKEFLDKYNKDIYPELLSRIIEIGILTLKLSFDKLAFTPQELDDIIYSLNEQSKFQNSNKAKKLKKLTNKFFKPETKIELENEKGILNSTNTFSLDDNIYFNTINSSNFYDSNYFVPKSRALRNNQLYQKRLEHPLFITQNKNIYPFWWWNFPEEKDSDNDDSSNELDYVSKSQSKSINSQNIAQSLNMKNIYDEEEIFKKNNFINDEPYIYNDNMKENMKNYNKNYYTKKNKTNYKISYDRNLNVIGVEKNNKKTNYGNSRYPEY
jgi:hypothetical protein